MGYNECLFSGHVHLTVLTGQKVKIKTENIQSDRHHVQHMHMALRTPTTLPKRRRFASRDGGVGSASFLDRLTDEPILSTQATSPGVFSQRLERRSYHIWPIRDGDTETSPERVVWRLAPVSRPRGGGGYKGGGAFFV